MYKIRISLLHADDCFFLVFLDDNGSQETETQNDIPGNWWFNLIAIQSEVAQSRNTLIDGVVHSIDGDRTDVGAINTCEYTKEMKVIGLTTSLQSEKSHRCFGKMSQTYF